MPSEQQIQIFEFIQAHLQETGRPPTFEEIRLALKLSSKSLVAHHVKALVAAGLVERTPQVSRGLRPTPPSGRRAQRGGSFLLPIKGWIRAGRPVFTGEVEDAIEVTRALVPDTRGLYGLRVRGDSMRDALIHDGDIVVLEHQSVAHNGEMVAVRLTDRDEFTLKRFYREPGRVRLRAANPDYPDLVIRPSVVEVQGRVVAVLRQF
jgi:repressor LexA